MTQSRSDICASASRKLADADVKKLRAVVGLDGFVDEIIEVVDKRQNAASYDRIHTIGQLAQKIAGAAGESSNYELVVTQQKLGGNGPIMANALAAMGQSVTYIGNLGFPTVHPVFNELTARAEVISIGEACHTDALEFLDGKILLGKLTPAGEVNWANIIARVGKERLHNIAREAQLIATVNWTMLPHMTAIWSHLLSEVLGQLPPAKRFFFVDLADPEKRTVDDLRAAMAMLQQFQPFAHVVLGLNLKEATQVAEATGLPRAGNPESAIEQTARALREKLKIGTVVIHPRRGAAAANEKESATFEGPFVAQPMISTGAGDHFNAGFISGQMLGLSLVESLCMGTATSGYYVRTAISPSIAQLGEFIANLPGPQIS